MEKKEEKKSKVHAAALRTALAGLEWTGGETDDGITALLVMAASTVLKKRARKKRL